MKVSEYIVKELIGQGVTDVFGIPGGVILDFLYALDQSDISIHLSYHEQAAAFEACGYAQLNYTLGVAYATRGPGFTNLITGIAEAYAESIPVLFITGHLGEKTECEQRFESDQEMDTVSIVKAITKYAAYIDSIDEVQEKIYYAFSLAQSGRKGPVLLDISASLWEKELNEALNNYEKVDSKIIPNLLHISNSIENSKKPIFLIGDGVNQSVAKNKIIAMINKTKIPVLSSRGAQDCGSLCHNYFGYIGSHGIRYANYIFENSDLVICLGNRLSFPLNSSSFGNAIKNKTIVRIENDKMELKRNIPNTIGIYGDIGEVVDDLDTIISKIDIDYNWKKECIAIKNKLMNVDTNKIVDIISSILIKQKEAVIVCDVGNNEFWSSRAYELAGVKNRILYSKSFGTLGGAIGKAIGVYYAARKPVICIVGDQGFQLNVQELQFISDNKLPIMIVIVNNNSSGMIKDRQKNRKYYLHTTSESGFGNPSYSYLAQAYRMKYLKVSSIRDMLYNEIIEPIILEVIVDGNLGLEPNLPKGNRMYDMLPNIDI